MLKISLNISSAIEKINNLIVSIPEGALNGIEESIYELNPIVKERARIEGYPEYADSVTSEMNRAQGYGIVGPGVEWAPMRELGRSAQYVWARCPWWRYLEPALRRRVPRFPMLREIAIENKELITNIIVKEIKGVIR